MLRTGTVLLEAAVRPWSCRTSPHEAKGKCSYVPKVGTTSWFLHTYTPIITVYSELKQKTHTHSQMCLCLCLPFYTPPLWATLTAHSVLHRSRLWCLDYIYSLTTCGCLPQISISQLHIGSWSIFKDLVTSGNDKDINSEIRALLLNGPGLLMLLDEELWADERLGVD